MNTNRTFQLTGIERHFDEDEFIVSKTDNRGIITYANDVFLRIAGYELEEVLGKPHNLIRHPRMPKCVFRLLWERIKTGNEIFAYVVNRCKNGDHYWVMAHVTPSYDSAGNIVGYHSNRRRPNPETVTKVQSLYGQLLEIEKQHGTTTAGLNASYEAMQTWVKEQGGNYDEIILSL
ncbi:PAS domain-containing protein [bacterium]|nr:PAS domain-containing protein [bacterium]